MTGLQHTTFAYNNRMQCAYNSNVQCKLTPQIATIVQYNTKTVVVF